MLRWAFDYLNLNRVHLTAYAYNRRAIRCYEKCGFQHGDVMRQARYHNGQYHDQLMMSVLRDEFLADQRSVQGGAN